MPSLDNLRMTKKRNAFEHAPVVIKNHFKSSQPNRDVKSYDKKNTIGKWIV